MKTWTLSCHLLGALLSALPAGAAESPGSLFRDGDRVALIGETFIEREQSFGHVEAAQLLASDARNLVIRNLGWSGDSVFNDARSYFGPPQEGRERLARAVGEFKPTVIFVGYGTGPALSVGQPWTGETGPGAQPAGTGLEAEIEVFLRGYRHLLDSVRKASGQVREIVLVTPPPLENLGPPLPDHVANNQNLAAYAKAIVGLAKEQGARSLDLFNLIGPGPGLAKPPLTENGIHYGSAGYEMIARHWTEGLGMKYRGIEASPLRERVIAKNRLFFHRWRPANETYLFLFRKHEQGNNAKEIPMFDPLIEEKEKEIEAVRAELKKQFKP